MANSSETKINNKFRDKTRNSISRAREANREIDIDSLRIGLGEIKLRVKEDEVISVQDIIGLANRIKRKKKATAKDLIRLSNGFLHGITHIETFMNIRDAVNIIVKMLTGSDLTLQIMACECLSNLSLGDERCCEKLAQVAGIYLTIYLSPQTDKQLSKTCLWVLSNLSGAGGRPLKILLSQKIVDKIFDLIQVKEDSNDNEFNFECCSVIESIIEHGKDVIDSAEKENILAKTLANTKFEAGLKIQLLYRILGCMDYQIREEQTMSCIEFCLKHLCAIQQLPENILSIIFPVRILGNFVAIDNNFNSDCITQALATNNISFSALINRLIELVEPNMRNEILWMVGNFYKSSNVHIINYLDVDQFVVNLKINDIY